MQKSAIFAAILSLIMPMSESGARVLAMSDNWAAEELATNDQTLCVIYNFPVSGRSFRLVSEQAGGELEFRLSAALPRGVQSFNIVLQFDRHPPLRHPAEAVPNASGIFEVPMNFRGLGGIEAALRSSSTIRVSFIGSRGDLAAFSLRGIGPALRAYLDCKERNLQM